MKRINKILGWFVAALGFSVSVATCGYGMPEGYNITLSGSVKSETTNMPIKGIKVTRGGENYTITNEKGEFSFITFIDEYYRMNDSAYRPDSIPVHFLDIDSIENGYFVDKTVIIDPAHKDEVIINIKLEEK